MPLTREVTSQFNMALDTRGELPNLLDAFLSSPSCPEYTMNFCQLDGYLRAIATGIECVPLSAWLPLIFADKKPHFASDTQAATILEQLALLYNFHVNEVQKGTCTLPCNSHYSVTQDDRIDIEQWARGFLQGYILSNDYNKSKFRENQSLDEKTQKLYDGADIVISIVSNVADIDYAIMCNGVPEDGAELIFTELPMHLVQYAAINDVLRGAKVTFCEFSASTWPEASGSLVW